MNFLFIIIAMAFAYSLVVRFIQFKLGKQGDMIKKNKRIHELNKEYLNATKRGDTERANEIQKEQTKLLKEIFSMTFSRMWVFGVIIILFFAFIFLLNYINPYTKDDITIKDITSIVPVSNETFEVCNFTIPKDAKPSVWRVSVKGSVGDKKISASSLFLVNEDDLSAFDKMPKPNNNGINLTTDKLKYVSGENVHVLLAPSEDAENILASQPASLECTSDAGTVFTFDFGFILPFFNVRYIDMYWTFILFSFICGIFISKFMQRVFI